MLSNNALVLTLPSSGQGSGVGGLRSGTCAFAPLRRGAMCRARGVGGLRRQRSTAPAVSRPEFSTAWQVSHHFGLARRSIARCRSATTTDRELTMIDIRSHLRQADQLVRDGEFAEAIGLYGLAAEHFASAAFSLKATALFRQVIKIIDNHAPHLAAPRRQALRRLHDLYTELGLLEGTADILLQLQPQQPKPTR